MANPSKGSLIQTINELAKLTNTAMSSFYNTCVQLISTHGDPEIMAILNVVAQEDSTSFVQYFLEDGALRPKPLSAMDLLVDNTKAIKHCGLTGYVPGEICEAGFISQAFCVRCNLDDQDDPCEIVDHENNSTNNFEDIIKVPYVVLRGKHTWAVKVEPEFEGEKQDHVDKDEAKDPSLYWVYDREVSNSLKRKYYLSVKDSKSQVSVKRLPNILVPRGVERSGAFYRIISNDEFQTAAGEEASFQQQKTQTTPTNPYARVITHLTRQNDAKQHEANDAPMLTEEEFWESPLATLFKEQRQSSPESLFTTFLPKATAAYWLTQGKLVSKYRKYLLKERIGKSAYQLYCYIYRLMKADMRGYAHFIYAAMVFSATSQFNYNVENDVFEVSIAQACGHEKVPEK